MSEQEVALSPGERNRILSSSIIGTAVEWYDFYLYSVSASVVFDKLFFPSDDPYTGTIAAFATFLVGFVVRPFGGIFFGHLGDRIGRKRVLVVTLVMMGGASVLIGCLPTHAQIGVWGGILLALCRAIQGFGAGAEYGGAVLMLAESAPQQRRGLWAALPYVGVAGGLLLANGVYALLSELPDKEFLSWGWRVAFIASIVGVAIGLIARFRLHETLEFQQVKRSEARVRLPFIEIFKHYKRNLFCAWGAQMADKSLAYIFESLVIVYVTKQLGLDDQLILVALLVASGVQFATVPLFGVASDRWGRKPVYIAGAVLSGLAAWPFFLAMDTKNVVVIWAAVIVASGFFKIMMTSAQAAWYAEMFPPQVRYSGFALAREGFAPLSGGIAPIVSVWLLSLGDGNPVLVIGYIVLVCLITVVSVALGPETLNRPFTIEDLDSGKQSSDSARTSPSAS